MTDPTQALAVKLEPLRPLVERMAKTTTDVMEIPDFLLCVMSSFAKAFEFAELTTKQSHESAFFLTSALRSTTEELIILNFLSGISPADRQIVLESLLRIDTNEDLEHQSLFMRRFRPFQPVLPGRIDPESPKAELLKVWQRNGWPNLKNRRRTLPPIREIAQRSDSGMLEVVYDFIYRLSSNSVHFRPCNLLSLGWKNAHAEWTFSSKSFPAYYLQIIQIYGCFLFCLYFELFEEFLKPSQDEAKAVKGLRMLLLQRPRWPEMVTFEEMNRPYPTVEEKDRFFRDVYSLIMHEGFLSGAKKLLES